MTEEHSAYEALAQARRGSDEYRGGYAEARRAFLTDECAIQLPIAS